MVSSDRRSTCQWLAFHARLEPTAVAIVQAGFHYTYHNLTTSVLRMMDMLIASGIRSGQIVGVETNDRYVHLVILLACEALDVTTISLVPSEFGGQVNLARLCDRIIASHIFLSCDPDKMFVLTDEWVAQVLSSPRKTPSFPASIAFSSPWDERLGELENQPSPDSVVRIIKTSGTTGVPKVMGMTHRVQDLTIQKNLLHATSQICPHPKFLCFYNFSLRGSHSRVLLTLQLGGTIYFSGINSAWEMIAAGTGNYILLVAGDLERLVLSVPAQHVPSDIQIDVIGAAISRRLRQQVRERITRHMVVTYGANEVHHISIVDDDNVGRLYDDVRVTIVSGDGTPVLPGQSGLIRVKSDTMTHEYIDAPELTQAAFLDGWYNTNDIGFQPAPGKLVVLGRADDMLNIGGLKIAPAPIEDRLKTLDGVLDAVVSSAADQMETNVLWIAVETGLRKARADIAGRVALIIKEHGVPYHLVVMSTFPRTESGKVQRKAIHATCRQVASVVRASGSG